MYSMFCTSGTHKQYTIVNAMYFSFQIQLMDPLRPSTSSQLSSKNENQSVNPSQLHQSRLGLLSQALMMIITTGFLFSETLEEFWKTKYDHTTYLFFIIIYFSISSKSRQHQRYSISYIFLTE